MGTEWQKTDEEMRARTEKDARARIGVWPAALRIGSGGSGGSSGIGGSSVQRKGPIREYAVDAMHAGTKLREAMWGG